MTGNVADEIGGENERSLQHRYQDGFAAGEIGADLASQLERAPGKLIGSQKQRRKPVLAFRISGLHVVRSRELAHAAARRHRWVKARWVLKVVAL